MLINRPCFIRPKSAGAEGLINILDVERNANLEIVNYTAAVEGDCGDEARFIRSIRTGPRPVLKT
jgi:hypothetical protein